MGMFDVFTGSKSAPKGVARQPLPVVRQALLNLNRPTAPWGVRDGSAVGVDLVAEWKIVDARWYEVFGKAGLEKVFRTLMRFDDAAGDFRAVDQEWSVQWQAGVPRLSLAAEAFRGPKKEISFGTAAAFREEDRRLGVVYDYSFSTGEIKKPLQEAALANGWGWRGVAFGKL
ncbi:hypothetical protein MYK68_05520 [Gordonia sp. PP30]|uniref:hypothetical protein n=1 Tax=Gordonia sp. PP30 TaxID=2935861 RepID=UPI001FFF8C49|nr:hypothetical protein [Gordonia sp. PP30]UQE76052.1 hypothetical protein MYK68_05520 [Gordonia sp. PP30]